MIPGDTLKLKSMVRLEHTNYADYKRALEYYDRWDMAAKAKDFHNAEHFDFMIQKMFKRNGLTE